MPKINNSKFGSNWNFLSQKFYFTYIALTGIYQLSDLWKLSSAIYSLPNPMNGCELLYIQPYATVPLSLQSLVNIPSVNIHSSRITHFHFNSSTSGRQGVKSKRATIEGLTLVFKVLSWGRAISRPACIAWYRRPFDGGDEFNIVYLNGS